MVSKDTLWKGIIENLVDDFIRFFFPQQVDLIDFSRPFEFLDTELQHLLPENPAKKRHADKLIKAWKKDGTEAWFLIHVEIQGYFDEFFAQRMFEISYRIRDKFQRPVTGLAIYTYWNRKYHYKEFRESFFGTEVIYSFNTYVIRDHPVEELTKNPNPFAAVIEAAWQQFKKPKNENLLADLKLKMIERLIARNIPQAKIEALIDFITLIVPFKVSKIRAKFEQDIIVVTKSIKPMGIREAILHEVENRGIEIGVQQGIEQGIEQGQEIREDEILRHAVPILLKKGFSAEEIAEIQFVALDKVLYIIEELSLSDNLDSSALDS